MSAVPKPHESPIEGTEGGVRVEEEAALEEAASMALYRRSTVTAVSTARAASPHTTTSWSLTIRRMGTATPLLLLGHAVLPLVLLRCFVFQTNSEKIA